MGSTTSSLVGSTWRATSALTPPPSTPHQPRPSFPTLRVKHEERTVLVRFPQSYEAALAAARKAFGLAAEDDVRLEVEWGGGGGGGPGVELTEDVWEAVQPGAKVFTKVQKRGGEQERERRRGGGEGEDDEERRKRARLSSPSSAGQAATTVDDEHTGPTAAARSKDVKGKGKAVNQDALAESSSTALQQFSSPDERYKQILEHVNRGDMAAARELFVSSTVAPSSSSLPAFTCPHGHTLPPQLRPTAADDKFDAQDAGDYDDYDVLIREHGGGVILRVPYEACSELTVEALYSMVDRKLRASPEEEEYTLVHQGSSLDRFKGWKRVSKWVVQGGDTILVVHTGQVIVHAFIWPRKKHIHLEAVHSSTYNDILSILAFTLPCPMDDLYISKFRWNCEDKHPPFPDEQRQDPEEALTTLEILAEDIDRGIGPVVSIWVWVMSETWAMKEKEEAAKTEGGGEASGSGLASSRKEYSGAGPSVAVETEEFAVVAEEKGIEVEKVEAVKSTQLASVSTG